MKEKIKEMLFCFGIGIIITALIWVFILLPDMKKAKAEEPKPEQQTETTIAEPETAAAEVAQLPPEIITPIVEPEPVYIGEFKLTAYCSCEKCCGVWATNRPKDEHGNDIVYTSTGAVAKAGRTIAVDTSVIPYGTEVSINGQIYVAEDCGGAIKGNEIDVYFDDHTEALIFGVQYADVYLYSNIVSLC